MRKAAICMLPLALLSACGGGGEAEKNKAAKVSALRAGQYEIATEVTSFRSADTGRPKIDTPRGTRATRTVCIADPANLPPDLFADEGFRCQTGPGAYVRDGTVSTSLSCRREGLNGSINYTVSGRFEAESFEVQRGMATSLATDGDVVINSTARGRRTGECSPSPAPANAAAPKAKQ